MILCQWLPIWDQLAYNLTWKTMLGQTNCIESWLFASLLTAIKMQRPSKTPPPPSSHPRPFSLVNKLLFAMNLSVKHVFHPCPGAIPPILLTTFVRRWYHPPTYMYTHCSCDLWSGRSGKHVHHLLSLIGRERNTHAQVPLAPKFPCGGRTTLSCTYVHMNTKIW